MDVDRSEGIVADLLGMQRTAEPLEALDLEPLRGPARYLPEHCWNVTRLALFTADQAGWDDADLAALGIAALWHDVGMLAVPPWRWLQERLLEPEDLSAVQAHSAAGAAMLERVAAWPPRVAAVVAQVHERHDGSGYPAGLSDDAIDPAARLLAVCDTYEALVSPRLYRLPFPPADAMRAVLAEAEAERFDPDTVRDFVAAVGLHPVGSLVTLADNARALVVAANREQPDRPVLDVLTDGAGRTLQEPRRVDMAREPGVQMAG